MLASLPTSRLVDPATGMIGAEWRQYFLNPRIQTATMQNALSPASGGTGGNTAPTAGQVLLGNGATYAPANQIPGSALPAMSGDVSTISGTTIFTLTAVNTTPGAYGSGSAVATYTVNAKGLITASASTPITGAQSMTVAAGFGCNGKNAQIPSVSGVPVVLTASTASTPFGYSTAAQADRIVALVNAIQAALIANGILV